MRTIICQFNQKIHEKWKNEANKNHQNIWKGKSVFSVITDGRRGGDILKRKALRQTIFKLLLPPLTVVHVKQIPFAYIFSKKCFFRSLKNTKKWKFFKVKLNPGEELVRIPCGLVYSKSSLSLALLLLNIRSSVNFFRVNSLFLFTWKY